MNLHAAQSFLMQERKGRHRPHRGWLSTALAHPFRSWLK